MKRIETTRSVPGTKALHRSLVLLALAMPLVPMAAWADETSELKDQIKALTERLSRLEAAQQKQAQQPQPESAATAAQPPRTQMAQMQQPGTGSDAPTAVDTSSQDPLLYDQNGNYIGILKNPVQIYSDGKTRLAMYGILEATISRVDHQANASGSGTSTETGFQVAWFSGNRLGFDIDHDLGDFGQSMGLPGLKVISKLESEVELPTGGMDTNGVFFNRDAWLGFSSPALGKVTFGRQNTLTRDFTQNWGDSYGTPDVTLREGGYSNVNNFKQLIFYSAASTGTRVNSGIEWKKKWGDHWVTGLGWAFGSQGNGGSSDPAAGGTVPGDFRKGTNRAVSVAYNGLDVGVGKFNLNASYDEDNHNDLVQRSELFGGNFVTGPYRINAGYIHFTAEQGVNNSLGTRTDRAWTTSGSARLGKTVFSLGYVRMGGENAGHNAGGVILNPMFGNTNAATGTTPSGTRATVFGSVMYQPDRALDLYIAADRLTVNGGWIVGDAQGNGTLLGAGKASQEELELAVGARFKF